MSAFVALALFLHAVPVADLVLVNGRFWTADPAQPWAEVVAIHSGRFTYVGPARGAPAARRTIDLGRRLAVPGFNDAHIHLMSGSLSLERVDLIEDQTLEAVQKRIREFATLNPRASWVLGRGWLYGSFPGGLPTKEHLDAVVPDRPAYMECYDGHSGWANSRALALAGITRETRDPPHGTIVRDPRTGEATGALKEAATALVESKVPRPDVERRYALYRQAMRRLNSHGITSVQDAGYTVAEVGRELPLWERALGEDAQTVRLNVSVSMTAEDHAQAIAEAERLRARARPPLLRFGAVKAYVDGVIEAHTAAMLEPYAGAEFGRGAPNWEPAALNTAVTAADKAGLQVYLHAIGDRGVRMALDAHERALAAGGRADRRGRIEHIETIHPADYPRFARLGVIASMQPLHANPDQNLTNVWRRNAGEDRASRGFSWRSIEKAGARLVFGSDWPVVTSDVMRGLFCALTRKTRQGEPAGGWLPEQAVSLESALRHYTIDAAYASFEEDEKGTIAVGRLADLAVLSRDLFREPPAALVDTRVVLTLLGGRVVHGAEAFAALSE